MKFNFKKIAVSKERFSAGVDIGTSFVKAVKLKFDKETVELCNFILEPIGIDPRETIKTISQSFAVDTVTMGIGGLATVIRYVVFPRMSQEELNKAVKFEAQKHIPFPISETNIDTYILHPELPDNKMLVLLAAAKKDFIIQRLKTVEEAAVKVKIIDLDSLALVNAFNFNYSFSEISENKVVALLNIGAAVSNLNILENGVPCLSRDIHIAGNNITHKIMDVLSLDLKSAEAAKLNPESIKEAKVVAAVETLLGNLAGELRTSFDFYESQSASFIKKIFLSGGGSYYAGLRDILANLLGMEVAVWDPFKKISFAEGLEEDKVKAVSGQLAVAVGLALR
ncbi:MAG: pilus assembly protein PilM [Candidatus Omnitrophica bacterium]|nr:pilus assembly protein PilM [Candidatus Omnitrophota bacterium]